MARTANDRLSRRWRLVRARPEAVPASLRRLTRKVRPRRPGPRRLWWWVALTALGAGVLGWVVFASPVLGVRQVEVTGSQIVSVEQIRALAGVRPGTPLARVDTEAIRSRLLQLPPVAQVRVHRSWPGTLRIDVTERLAVAAALVGRRYLLLDRTGMIFHTVDRRPAGVILVQLSTPGRTDPATLAAVRVVSSLTPPIRAQVAVLVAESAGRIRLELTSGGQIIWGDAENSELKARVASSLLRPADTRTIDVSAPEVVTVR
ncbi:MAG TPA: FtsQ-type POTRA domain-containing protein [Micromonosporaceae bacterium]